MDDYSIMALIPLIYDHGHPSRNHQLVIDDELPARVTSFSSFKPTW
jgi:hypothetical protein